MDVAALIVAIVALLGALLATRRVAILQERLDRTSSQLSELRNATGETMGELQDKLNELRLQVQRPRRLGSLLQSAAGERRVRLFL